ncbi:hypothetical protein ACTYEO_06495 [Rhodophyticola sp. SM2404]
MRAAVFAILGLVSVPICAAAQEIENPSLPRDYDPVVSFVLPEAALPIGPREITAIEMSESGGITDIFFRFKTTAAMRFDRFLTNATGEVLEVRVCGYLMQRITVPEQPVAGAFYLSGTNALRGEAIRALWHGRAQCNDFEETLFPQAI